ncbi:hypothetical protein BD410DRAFT_560067 [Rickenella mellea]|uniref:BTB domain-containing protein n=1 Tax=Rickenella mellea TaxID=50990 RepID=A0A4Y7QEZ9_9AGAM|nr:hypothetical protein BD410DRAFT_560067 [Rickenella mellea]
MQRSSQEYHKDLTFEDGDIVLCSKDGTHFRLFSQSLKVASGFFRDMFTLPQPNTRTDKPDIIQLEESREVLERLFGLMCGLPVGYCDAGSLELIEDILNAAEKYEMPGPAAYFRALMRPRVTGKPSPLLQTPLRLYRISCRHRWIEEAKAAATLTLALDFEEPQHRPALHMLESRDLLRLLDLRRKRKNVLKKYLEDSRKFPFGKDADIFACQHCQAGLPALNLVWKDVKAEILEEMERRPLGDTLTVFTPPCSRFFAKMSRAAACHACTNANGDLLSVFDHIRRCITTLPSSIDLSFDDDGSSHRQIHGLKGLNHSKGALDSGIC